MVKNPASKDPKAALKNAYKISNDTERLIAVDIKNDQFVIFDNTSGNVYHGHIRTYKEIERNAVLKNNLIKTNGKIIK
ncbi:hypothetical protein [Rickettsia tamurae]|uniref:hypothetical protein n=1 Tax=Rickettsia tamurae TaxID=334545 RepID=UPI0006894D1B|nr:hypothetical protein [Rickettsia tamurae]